MREGLLLLSLAATYGAGIRSLLPLTKSFLRHLCHSAQADVRAPVVDFPFPSRCASSILSRLSQGLTERHVMGPFSDPTGMQISVCLEETSILGAKHTRILKY